MLQLILSFITLIVGLSFFFIHPRSKKLCWLLVTVCCFSMFRSPIPLMKDSFIFFPICFFFSEMKFWGKSIKAIRHSLLFPLTIWMFVASVVLICHSPHYNDSIKNIIKFFESETICSYWLICFAYAVTTSKSNTKDIYSTLYHCLIVLTIFGVINLVFHQGVFVDIVSMGRDLDGAFEDAGSKYVNADRFRVQSMFLNPFDYGYICLMILIYTLYANKIGLLTRPRFIVSVVCCLFGIFSCNTRTLIIVSLFAVVVFVLLSYKLKKQLQIMLSSILLFLLLSHFIPYISSITEQILSIIPGDESDQYAGGSSFEMRQNQFLAVLFHIKDDLLLGRGKGFFYFDLDYSGGLDTLKDKDLLGLEGVYLSLLLEKGILGAVFYYVYWISLIVFALVFLKKAKLECSAILSILVAYLGFAHGTGELSSLYPTLLLLGFFIKLNYLSYRNENSKNRRKRKTQLA